MAATATVAPATTSARGTHGPHDHNLPAEVSGLAATTAKQITIPEDDSRSHIALAWALIIAGCIGSAIALGTISWLALTSTDLRPILSLWQRAVS